ncbi:MAG: molybdate ABC transporter substrate-binding protein [Ilumatobacteraceae bacterium]
MRRATSALVAVALSVGFTGCGSGAATPVRTAGLEGAITVSAAVSLTDSFTELAKQFRTDNPKVKVQLNFGSSSSLVAQIQAGAPADIMASADLGNIEKLVDSGHVVGRNYPKVFARNSMAIAVKPGNPLDIKTVADLASAKFVALCGKTVPCGIYAASVIARAGISIAESKVTRGVDAKATLGAVATGDADAAVVYYTDVVAAKKSVLVVNIPQSQNVNAVYGIAPIRGSKNLAVAEAFIAFALSDTGQKILQAYGFERL